VRVLGIASDTEEQLHKLRAKHDFPFTMLSDPMLLSADVLDVPVSTKTSFLSVLGLHPVVRHLPKKAFLQPAFFVWKGTELVYEWRQTETLRNLIGACGRPDEEQVLEITRQAMG
jgi:hypothetical protein